MGTWYTIGILAGAGAALGVFGVATIRRAIPAAVAALVVAALIGYVAEGTAQAVAGGIGALLAAFGAGPLVAGTLRRGGTRAGTATLLAAVAILIAALAFVPVLGYLEALAVPALGLRLRRRAPDTHAGLRSLTK
jgi:hypothetical protein